MSVSHVGLGPSPVKHHTVCVDHTKCSSLGKVILTSGTASSDSVCVSEQTNHSGKNIHTKIIK